MTLIISEERRRHLELVGNRPEKMYGSCKVHRKSADGCLPFRAILSALQIHSYKLAKFLVSNSEPLTTNKYSQNVVEPLKMLIKIPVTSWVV